MNPAWPAIVPIALLPLIFHWIPLWRRNGIWFGVTVAPGFTHGPEARAVLHRFRIAIWLLALAAVAMTALASPANFPWAFPAAMTLELGGALAAFAHGRRQTLPHAARLGIGYTCNFGNRTTWLLLGLILLFSLIPVLLRYL